MNAMTHPLPQPSDEAVSRACEAANVYWDDPSKWIDCEACRGRGFVAVGDSQDYCDNCGANGTVHSGTEEGAMAAALTAAHAALVAEVERLITERDQWRNTAKLEVNERKSWESRAEAAERELDHYKARANEAQESAQFWIGEHNEMERQRDALKAELSKLAQRDEAGARDAEEVRQLRVLADEAWIAWDGDEDTRVGKFLRAMIDPAFRKTYRPDLSAAIDRAAKGNKL